MALAKFTDFRPFALFAQQVRYNRKPRITRPRAAHTLRAHVEYLAQPKYVDYLRVLPPNETCELNAQYREAEVSAKTNVTLYETVLAREALKKFQNSSLTLIFHRNIMEGHEIFDARLALHKLGFRYEVIGKKILDIALRGTKYETVLPLFKMHESIAFGPETVEQKQVKALLKSLRKSPGLVLMGAVVEHERMFSPGQLKEYSEWPDKRVELVSTLTRASGVNLTQSLGYQMAELSRILSSVGKDKES